MPTLTFEELRANILSYAQSQNLTFDPRLGTYVRDALGSFAPASVPSNTLAEHTWLDCQGATLAAYKIAMNKMLEEDRAKRQRNTAEMLCNIDDEYDLAIVELRRFIKLMAHEHTEPRRLEYYEVAWKQFIWQIKRKLLGRDSSWEIMMSLVSRVQGSGKTEACRSFGDLMEEFFKPDGDCTIFSDHFRLSTLQRYYLVLLDEFDRANKAQVATFKRIISSRSVSSRQIYTDSELVVSRNASFIVTSNRSIAHDITDTSMRRFVEMRCREQRATDTFIDAMMELRWQYIWSVADARDDEAPAYENSALMNEFQHELATTSDFDEWAEERIFWTENKAVRLSMVAAYNDYAEWARNQGLKVMPKRSFKREAIERYAIVRPQGREHISKAQLRAVC